MDTNNKYLKRKFSAAAMIIFIMAFALTACRRYEPAALDPDYDASDMMETTAINVTINETDDEDMSETGAEGTDLALDGADEDILNRQAEDTRTPVKVKGLYLASKPLGSESFMSTFWENIDGTEINAVVIDVKDDYGRVTYDMQGVDIVDELGSVSVDIPDMQNLLKEFEERGIYTIARIVFMRDPYIGETKPEWCMYNADGTLYTDNSGYTWINPYKTEYWDYIVDIAKQCAADGFDEIQFDYIRFSTDSGADDCVFDEADTLGRDKISIITEAVQYLYDNISPEGVFVSCDVYGTIIGSSIDSRAVGQDYTQLAAIVDYMCPMIYPSHYAAGNFGLDIPDKHPYETISGALNNSRTVLSRAAVEGEKQAIIRPWLQNFTATWLGSGNYIEYGSEEIREQIQAVYDTGHDEWMLWSASVNYNYDAFLSEEEAEAEYADILESRAAIPPEETAAEPEETFPAELSEALDGDDLSEEDKAILEQDGPIITYEQ